MSSTSGNNFGHGASPFTGPNQVLVSGVLGQRTTVDMNSAPVGHVLARTADGLGAVAQIGATEDGTIIIGFSAGAAGLGVGVIGIGRDVLDGTMGNSPTGIVAIGDGAMSSNISDANCNSVAVGSGALALMRAPNNTAVGHQSGATITNGNNTVFVGSLADSSNGNSVNVVAVGASARIANNGCIAIGQSANASGIDTIVIGRAAGRTTLGNQCIAIGTGALANGSSAVTQCVAIGHTALGAAMTGTAQTSTAVGFAALGNVIAGTGNTAVGHNAGNAMTNGNNNTFVGAATVGNGGTSNQTLVGAGAFCNGAGCIVVGQGASAGGGSDTIVIGRAAGRNTLGASCVFIGVNAGDGGSIANIENVGIGANALGGTLGGGQNTAVGNSAGSTLGTGTNNAFFGAGTNGSANLNSQTCLGAGTTTTAAGAIAIGRNGAGTSAVGAVADGLAFPTTLAQVAPGLAVQFNAGAMGPTTSSIRYKKDVTLAPTIADTPGQLKPFDRIRVVEFDSKVDGDEKRHLGIIAEELVDLVHPSLIPRDVEGNPVGISYDRLVCLAIQEIQLLRRRVSILESAPLPELGVYVPVRARDLYDDDQIDDETQTLQKQQYKDRSRQLRIDRVVERIEKNPARETAILNRLNKVTRDLVRKAMEDKAALEAQAEAKAEAEAQAEKEAKLNAIARRKMAEGKADEAGPKMKARIAALIEADRVAAEAQAQARAEAAAEAQRQAKALEDADKALEEADEQE